MVTSYTHECALLEKNIGFQTEHVFSDWRPDAGLTSASLSFDGGNLTLINLFDVSLLRGKGTTGSLETKPFISLLEKTYFTLYITTKM